MFNIIFAIPLSVFMIWSFWQISNVDLWINQYPAIQWTLRGLGIIPLCALIWCVLTLLGTQGWQYHWNGKSDGTDKATTEMKRAFRRETGRDFPK